MLLSAFGLGSLATLFFFQLETPQPVNNAPAPAATYFTTGWETVQQWTRSQNGKQVVYAFDRNTPQLQTAQVKNGTLVVFIKGYDFSGFSKNPKPMSLPFYFLSPEASGGSCNWKTESSAGNIRVAIDMEQGMEPGFLKSNKDIQVRYFMLTPAFLKQHGLTQQSLRGISYGRLTQLLGLMEPQA